MSVCECIVNLFSRQLSSVDGIASSMSRQSVITATGDDPAVVTFGLPRPSTSYSDGFNGTGLVMMTMIVMFVVMIITIRRNNQRSDDDTAIIKHRAIDADNQQNPRRDDGGQGNL